jgi:hypothetical protein
MSCVFEGNNILVCHVESWILHGVLRVEKVVEHCSRHHQHRSQYLRFPDCTLSPHRNTIYHISAQDQNQLNCTGPLSSATSLRLFNLQTLLTIIQSFWKHMVGSWGWELSISQVDGMATVTKSKCIQKERCINMLPPPLGHTNIMLSNKMAHPSISVIEKNILSQ